MEKTVLLIAGGGTLGTYTAQELLRLGYEVEVIAREKLVSCNRKLHYIQAEVSDELLRGLFAQKRYASIVDFIHYPDAAAYEARGRLLMANTDHLVFLSSYRVYANAETPVRETSPQLIDTSKDEYFLQHETYAVPKSKAERFLRGCEYRNWTIVRPLISFSHFRVDMVTSGAAHMLPAVREGRKILLPAPARNLHAGLVWAGNSGKMIARLAVSDNTFCEDYTIGTGENLTWDEVAQIYRELLGAEFEWIDPEDYLHTLYPDNYMMRCALYCDRLFDREVDVSKVMAATGLTGADLPTIREGLIFELQQLANRPDLVAGFEQAGEFYQQRTEEYLVSHGLK